MALSGCARFETVQEDIRGDTRIVTRVHAVTWFSGRSRLANFSASQTEKTQGAKVGDWSGESDVKPEVLVQSAVQAAVEAALKWGRNENMAVEPDVVRRRVRRRRKA